VGERRGKVKARAGNRWLRILPATAVILTLAIIRWAT